MCTTGLGGERFILPPWFFHKWIKSSKSRIPLLFRNKDVLEWNNLFFRRFNLQVQADWFFVEGWVFFEVCPFSTLRVYHHPRVFLVGKPHLSHFLMMFSSPNPRQILSQFYYYFYLDVPGRNLGSMVRMNGLFHLLTNGVHWGYNPLILTFDLNFLPGTSK